MEPPPAGDRVHDVVRDTAADLGLGLMRLQPDRHHLEDVFLGGRPGPARDGGPVAERAGVIHDLGYRHYDGPRDGAATIARTLYVTGLRHAFGLGRSGKSKILPFLLLALSPCRPRSSSAW